MGETTNEQIFRYWGKADPNYPGEPKWHPLVYHSLDVAGVAAVCWDSGIALQRSLITAFSKAPRSAEQIRAWVLFFIAIHDLGKFDLRFQRKADAALLAAWQGIDLDAIAADASNGFDHGAWGMKWGCAELASWAGASDLVRDCLARLLLVRRLAG